MNTNLNSITKQLENTLLRSRGLSDQDFMQLINNIEIIKIYIIQLRKKLNYKGIKLFETKELNFYQYLNSNI